jgi:hypothetical protein
VSFTRCFMGQILGMFGFTNIHFGKCPPTQQLVWRTKKPLLKHYFCQHGWLIWVQYDGHGVKTPFHAMRINAHYKECCSCFEL